MRRRLGCVTGSLVLVILGAAYFAIVYGVDAFYTAPWAYGILGRPTLTGGWSGGLTTPGGTHYLVYLELDRSTSRRGPLNSSLSGRAYVNGRVLWCARGIQSADFVLDGITNRDASIVSLVVRSPVHPRAGLVPGTFQGAWHGATLALRARFRRFDGRSFVYSSAHRDDTTAVGITLHKSDVGPYRAGCARR